MTLLPFLIVTIGGALAVLFVRGPERLATAVGLLALLVGLVSALAIRPNESLAIGASGLATTGYLRLFLVLGSLVGLILAVIGAAAGSRRDATAVTLAVLGTSALALSLPDARLAVLAATAGGAFGALLCVAPLGGRAGATIGIRALRATVVAGTMAIAAIAWIGRDLSDLAAQPVVFGLAYLAVALAVAIRFGVIPVHAWAARLADAVPETTLPLVTAWAPAALAIVALAWADASIAPLRVDIDVDQARAVVLAVALASIVLASVAAWIQDDLEHIVGYAIIGEAGVVMLAVAALDPEAWAPARMWILSFVVARSAFAAWAAAMRTTFFTGRVADLRGWAIRSPLLAIAFLFTVLASIGLPGLAAFDARGALIAGTVDGPLAVVAWIGVLSPLAFYGRLFLVGVGRPDPRPGGDTSWLPVISPMALTDLRRWATMTWSDNRAFIATGSATLLAVVALAVSAGMFGGPAAAAGLPPTIERAVESLEPDQPESPLETPGPSLEPEPSVELEPSLEGDPGASEPGPEGSGPSFAPVPTASG
ncbi:MAG: proton-conducting transporter membrane subunit [Candidatus Limnocylindrales bacterium]